MPGLLPVNAAALVETIRSQGYRVRQIGNHYRCQCPGHDGEGLHLDVKDSEDGKVLLRCFSHLCPVEIILQNLGLPMSAISGDNSMSDRPIRKPPYAGRGAPVARYSYRDAKGNVVLEQWRFYPKSFGPVTLQPDGTWKEGGGEKALWPLFHTPEVIAADSRRIVFIANGEKAVLELEGRGLVATCNPFGESQHWSNHPLWAQTLSGRRCVILVDNDEAGRKHAVEVKAALEGTARAVDTLALRDLPEGGDVYDWFAAGHTTDELLDLVTPPKERLARIVYTGEEVDALDIPEPEWLVPGLVSKANLTILAGPGKLGKSILALQLTVSAACGASFLGVEFPKTRALYVNWEDSLALTRSRARIQMAGEPLPNDWLVMDKPTNVPLADFLEFVGEYVVDQQVGLVVMDPLGQAARWKNENDNAEVGPTIQTIQDVAARAGIAIVAACHTRKSGGDHGNEVRGASALFNGVQGFLSFHRTEGGVYALERLNKMSDDDQPTIHLKRDVLTKSWHVTDPAEPKETRKMATAATPPLTVLSLLGERDAMTVAELLERTGLSDSTLRRAVAALRESSWITVVEQKQVSGRPQQTCSITGMGRRYLRAHLGGEQIEF